MAKQVFKIEKGVSPPFKPRLNYPFLEMDVGDSFLVPPEHSIAVVSAASYAGKRNNRKFSVRRVDGGGVRVFRIA